MLTFTTEEIAEGGNGVCISCHEVHYGGVEPDAEEYECEECGKNTVMGLEMALICGLIDIED